MWKTGEGDHFFENLNNNNGDVSRNSESGDDDDETSI